MEGGGDAEGGEGETDGGEYSRVGGVTAVECCGGDVLLKDCVDCVRGWFYVGGGGGIAWRGGGGWCIGVGGIVIGCRCDAAFGSTTGNLCIECGG